MIYIEQKNGTVTLTHYMPFDKTFGLGKTEEELLQTGILVESIPTPVEVTGKSPILRIDGNNNLFYDYVPRPLTSEEEIQQLKEKQTLMQQALDELIFGGAL